MRAVEQLVGGIRPGKKEQRISGRGLGAKLAKITQKTRKMGGVYNHFYFLL